MDLKEFFETNYDITKKRKLINSSTNNADFYHKAFEELQEIKEEMIQPNKEKEMLIEIGDLMCVCANWIKHKSDNPENVIKYVLNKNQKRINNK